MPSDALWELLHEELAGFGGAEYSRDPRLRTEVKRIHQALTEGRATGFGPRSYLSGDTARAAYLAYYVPLTLAKMSRILEAHPEALGSARDHEPLRWADFGCGPGTAALAALAVFARGSGPGASARRRTRRIQIDLVDQDPRALATALRLCGRLARKLGLDVETKAQRPSVAGDKPAYDLALASNVLNELPAEGDPLLDLWRATRGALVILEPGHRVASQRLIRLRERLLREKGAAPRILGPCLHAARCPLARTKHWCHFSEPVHSQRLIALNRALFADARPWLKFSYLAVMRGRAPEWDGQTFRAIGDLHPSGPRHFAIDLCRPETKLAHRVPRGLPAKLREGLVRGAIVRVARDGAVEPRPFCPTRAVYESTSVQRRKQFCADH